MHSSNKRSAPPNSGASPSSLASRAARPAHLSAAPGPQSRAHAVARTTSARSRTGRQCGTKGDSRLGRATASTAPQYALARYRALAGLAAGTVPGCPRPNPQRIACGAKRGGSWHALRKRSLFGWGFRIRARFFARAAVGESRTPPAHWGAFRSDDPIFTKPCKLSASPILLMVTVPSRAGKAFGVECRNPAWNRGAMLDRDRPFSEAQLRSRP